MSSEYDSPPTGPVASSFTPANSQNPPIIITPQRQSSSSPSLSPSNNGNGSNRLQQDDETSSQRSMKRSHSAMEMDVDSPAPNLENVNESSKKRQKDKPSSSIRGPTSASKGTSTPARKTYNSVFSGSKIKHLKKKDGEPLWRRDIQYEFLCAVFHDDKKVFTNSYDGTKGHTFADVYIDAMARSSKTSKVLRDKLFSDRPSALNMAMVCLLVNIGRMNTTLNFFPEMRAQLRTYHPIPSLQDYADPAAYKQLQDAPRLKSILKGASEDRQEPNTLEKLVNLDFAPRTNPINLCFVFSTYAPKVTNLHFGQPRDFFDLIMRTTLSSKSRARAYLWLNWWYLESMFTQDDALNNPYGPGQYPDAIARTLMPEDRDRSRMNSTAPGSEADESMTRDAADERKKADEQAIELESDRNVTAKFKGLPVVVPAFEALTEEQAYLENVDTEGEKKYGNTMHAERIRKMQDPETALPPPRSLKKSKKNGGDEPRSTAASPGRREDGASDSDATRSASPDPLPKKSRNTNSSRHNPNPLAPPNPADPNRINFKLRNKDGSFVIHADTAPATKKYSRPLTQHQLAVQANRKNRVNHEITKMVIAKQSAARKQRIREGPIKRAWRRIKGLKDEDVFAKSDDEIDAHHHHDRRTGRAGGPFNNGTRLPGPAGMVALDDESDDAGEEAEALEKMLRRVERRMERWENAGDVVVNGRTPVKKDEQKEVDEVKDQGDTEGDTESENDEAEVEGEGEGEDERDGGDEMDMSEN